MLGMACNTCISCQHFLKNLPTGPWALESRGRNAQGYGMCRASEKSGWFQSLQPPGSHHSHSSGAARPACQGHRPETSLLLAPLSLLARWGYGTDTAEKVFLRSWLAPVKIALSLTQCQTDTISSWHCLSKYAQPTHPNIKWWRTFPESTVSWDRLSENPGYFTYFSVIFWV